MELNKLEKDFPKPEAPKSNEIKDSGKKREFSTGAHRDFAEGKGRMDLLPHAETNIVFNMVLDEGDKFPKSLSGVLYKALTEILIGMQNLDDETCIIRAAALIAIAEGIHENTKTYDVSEPNSVGMFTYGIIQVSKHYEAGAKKYGPNNWKNGMPCKVYLDSAMRHLAKSIAGMEDEPHIRAACWNLLCYLWTRKNKPELIDAEF